MSDISVPDVVSAIRQMMERPRNPLAVETVDITPDTDLVNSGSAFHAARRHATI